MYMVLGDCLGLDFQQTKLHICAVQLPLSNIVSVINGYYFQEVSLTDSYIHKEKIGQHMSHRQLVQCAQLHKLKMPPRTIVTSCNL